MDTTTSTSSVASNSITSQILSKAIWLISSRKFRKFSISSILNIFKRKSQNCSDEVNEDDSLIFREPSVESEDTPEKRWEVGHFDPPLYRQRYDKVLTLLQNDLWKNVMSRVADFGCAEAKFVVMLKSLPRVREAIGVDINENLLDLFRHRIEPLFIDYLEPRPETPLSMYLMAGSVAEVDVRLLDIDAVTSIEL